MKGIELYSIPSELEKLLAMLLGIIRPTTLLSSEQSMA